MARSFSVRARASGRITLGPGNSGRAEEGKSPPGPAHAQPKILTVVHLLRNCQETDFVLETSRLSQVLLSPAAFLLLRTKILGKTLRKSRLLGWPGLARSQQLCLEKAAQQTKITEHKSPENGV